jgi:chromosome partitioning protein
LASVPIEERYTKLQEFVDEQLGHYDLVVLDLPGKSDNIAINGLVAAGDVLAPVKPGKFEQNQLASIQKDLAAIRDEDLTDVDLPRRLQLVQVIVTMFQSNRTLQEDFVDHVNEEYADLAAPVPVNQTEDILHAQSDGHTLLCVSDEGLYETGKRARERYETITADLLERLA